MTAGQLLTVGHVGKSSITQRVMHVKHCLAFVRNSSRRGMGRARRMLDERMWLDPLTLIRGLYTTEVFCYDVH